MQSEVRRSLFTVPRAPAQRDVPDPDREARRTGCLAALTPGTRRRDTAQTARRIRHAPRGIVYPMLLGSILIIGIATAGVAELWATQMKRDKEEELLFRLAEFRRAIIRYRADHNRLPKELKDLLEDKTQLQTKRYLRRLYPDPMTGKPDWVLKLVVDRAGVVSGIEDIRSTSTGKPLRSLPGKKAETSTYKDW